VRIYQALLLLLLTILLNSCSELFERFEMRADVAEIGDAMEHCKSFMEHILSEDVQVFIDEKSTRETVEHYDIYLLLYDAEQEGWAQCRVNHRGEIIFHAIRDFQEKGRSFQ